MAADEEETLLAPAPSVVVEVPSLHQQHSQKASAAEIPSAGKLICADDDTDANMSKATFIQVGNWFSYFRMQYKISLLCCSGL